MKLLTKNLKSLYSDGGDGNFLNISRDPYYVQVIGPRKNPVLYIDAVSNEHLTEEEKISDEQTEKIRALGFEEDPRSHNFSIEMPFGENQIPKIDEMIVNVLGIYGVDPYKAEFELTLE
ncbi:MAG: TY-Chap domain-containing protein [Promethearchaeota archaeon]